MRRDAAAHPGPRDQQHPAEAEARREAAEPAGRAGERRLAQHGPEHLPPGRAHAAQQGQRCGEHGEQL